MRRTQGYIPRNLGEGTIWDGRLKKRNAIEAVIVCVIIYGISKILELFLPYLAAVAIRLILWFFIGGITLKGAYGEPLSLYFLNMINYSNQRTYVTLKPPQKILPEAEKKRREREPGEKKRLTDRIFTKGPKRHDTKKK